MGQNGKTAKSRKFETSSAVRTRVPLMIGLMGPSGGGKTFSALRLAKGIQRVCPGPIYLIDTESRRALHYAPRPGEPVHDGKNFAFKHVVFSAPFSPLDYLAAIEHCVNEGAATVIIDSMSHEHEGPGGVLEWQADEAQRLAKKWGVSVEKVGMAAWGPPKAARRRLINSVLQLPANLICCFRAKNKLKIKKGADPEPKGYMAIAGEEFVFEMTCNMLLPPGANGRPLWRTEMEGEREMIKLPEQFRHMFVELDDRPLDEDVGEKMARWAAGEGAPEFRFPKGEHKGKMIRDAPADYLAKLVANDKTPANMRELYEAELARRVKAEADDKSAASAEAQEAAEAEAEAQHAE